MWLLWPGEAWAARSAIASRADVRIHAPAGRGFGVRVDHALGRSVATDRAILPRMGKNCFFVNRVIDGDTLRLRNGERVRLIGVDTPETKHPRKPVEPFGPEATAFTRAAIEHRLIGIERNTAARDKYGRLLAYVFRKPDRLFLNAELVRQGFGRAYTRFPFRRKAQFVALEREARRSRRGLWAAETAAIREPPRRRERPAPGGEPAARQPPAGRGTVPSRATSARGASASTTSPAAPGMHAPGSMKPGASAGSAPNRKPAAPAGAHRWSEERED